MEKNDTESNEKDIAVKDNTRFVRWQQMQIKQMSYTNNLFILLDIGFMGFLITQSGLSFKCGYCVAFSFQLLTFLFLLASFLTGIGLTINRLQDFRKTKDIVRLKEKKQKKQKKAYNDWQIKESIETLNFSINQLKTKIDRLGKRSWCLFYWQTICFTLGVILGVIFLILINN